MARVDFPSWLTMRRMPFLVAGGLVIILLFGLYRGSHSLDSLRPSGILNKPPHEGNQDIGSHKFTFGLAKVNNDAIDGLSHAQCDSQFPGLYTEIDNTVDHWKQELAHTIQSQDLHTESKDAAMRILIHENEMRILSCTHAVDKIYAAAERGLGVIYLIQRALDSAVAAGDRLPTVEVTLELRDDAEPPEDPLDRHAFWSFARTINSTAHKRLFLMPNFDFWFMGVTGSFLEAKFNAIQHDAPFASKIPQVVWRGNVGFNPDVRGSLLEYAEGKEWSDIKQAMLNEDPPSSMDVDEFCRYAMTVYTEGVTYSGRLKFLMNCESLLISHETAYATHYSHLLIADGPDQNFVQVKRDWSDLDTKVRYYLDHPEEAERIIANNLATFRSRYTTRAAVSCYLRRLIHSYHSVSFTPNPYRPRKDGAGKRLRGISFEQFTGNPQDKDYEID